MQHSEPRTGTIPERAAGTGTEPDSQLRASPHRPFPGQLRTAPRASVPGPDARTVVLVVSPVQHGSGLGTRRDAMGRDARSGPAGPSARFEGAVRRRPAAISARPALPCPAARPLGATPTPTSRRDGSRRPIAPRLPACPGGMRPRAAHAETLLCVQTPCRGAVAVHCCSPLPAPGPAPPPAANIPCVENGGTAEGNPGPVTSGLPPALSRDVRRAPASRGGGHGEEPGAEGGEGGQRLRYRPRRCRREGPREGPGAARHLRAEEGEREPAGAEPLRGFPRAAGLRVLRSRPRPWFFWAASMPRGQRGEVICLTALRWENGRSAASGWGELGAGGTWACWNMSGGPQK